MSEQERLQINWVTSAGGALGAVSSAVVLSSLGAAGTLVGAAVGSLCITVGGAIYSHYLSMTKNRVAAQALAARRSGRERGAPGGSEADPQQEPGATQEPDRTDGSDGAERAEGAEEGRSVRQLLRGLPWKRIAVISAALFGVAMVLIVAFELLTGRAVSTYTGGTSDSSVGTSIPGWSGTGQTSPDAEPDEPAPGDVEDGGEPQEEAPAEEGDAPAEEGDAPAEEAPAEGGDAPQEEAPAEPAPEPAAPEAPAP